MPVQYNNKMAQWAKDCLAEVGGLTLRQTENRTGINYSTIKNILDGRVPEATILIRFAMGFKKNVPEILRIAGYGDIAEAWEEAAGKRELTYEREGDENEEMVISINDVPPLYRPGLRAIIQTYIENIPKVDDDFTIYGQGKDAGRRVIQAKPETDA